MAPRIGFTLEALRKLDSTACRDDVRLVWKDSDRMNVGIVQPVYEPTRTPESWGNYFIQNLCVCSPRELRLLGLQMIEHAAAIERQDTPTEVILP